MTKRILACLLAVVLCMTLLPTTALAYSDEDSEPEATEEVTAPTEEEIPPETKDEDAWTPDGNLDLVDDIVQEDKQFITVQSKAGNYFYLVIDRNGDKENVYFMNLVDEADLMALIEGNGEKEVCTCSAHCEVGAINSKCSVCRKNMTECMGKSPAPTEPQPTEPETQEDKDSGSPLPALILLLAVGGVGAVYYLRFRKPQPDTKGSTDLDDYDYGEPDIGDAEDEPYEIEDEDPYMME